MKAAKLLAEENLDGSSMAARSSTAVRSPMPGMVAIRRQVPSPSPNCSRCSSTALMRAASSPIAEEREDDRHSKCDAAGLPAGREASASPRASSTLRGDCTRERPASPPIS